MGMGMSMGVSGGRDAEGGDVEGRRAASWIYGGDGVFPYGANSYLYVYYFYYY